MSPKITFSEVCFLEKGPHFDDLSDEQVILLLWEVLAFRIGLLGCCLKPTFFVQLYALYDEVVGILCFYLQCRRLYRLLGLRLFWLQFRRLTFYRPPYHLFHVLLRLTAISANSSLFLLFLLDYVKILNERQDNVSSHFMPAIHVKGNVASRTVITRY